MLASLSTTLLTSLPLALACAVLSVFVVLRHWAFIGEGIAHAGFGGAGAAWLLALVFPHFAFFGSSDGVYLIAILFSFLAALAIATLSRRHDVHTDTAIGIFLVASFAFGVIAQGIYRQDRRAEPPFWSDALFGQPPDDFRYVIAAIVSAAAVVMLCRLLFKELLAYTYDPALAQTSGVRTTPIHYLLILLITLTIVVGLRLMGAVLVTALLVLPGATALLLSTRLRSVFIIAACAALLAALIAPFISARFPFLQTGPTLVLILVAQFLLAWAFSRRSAAISA